MGRRAGADQTAAAEVEKRAQNTAGQIMEDMRKSVTGLEMMPGPDGGFVPIVRRANGNADMAGGFFPGPKPEAPLPPGMMPTQAMRGGVKYESPQAKPAKPNISWQTSEDGKSKVPYESVTDPKTGLTVLRRVKIVDENGDGIDDRQQSGWQSWAEQ